MSITTKQKTAIAAVVVAGMMATGAVMFLGRTTEGNESAEHTEAAAHKDNEHHGESSAAKHDDDASHGDKEHHAAAEKGHTVAISIAQATPRSNLARPNKVVRPS